MVSEENFQFLLVFGTILARIRRLKKKEVSKTHLFFFWLLIGWPMSIQSKSSSLQAYNLLLFRKALHPEFFSIQARKRLDFGEYGVEIWLFPGGHAVRYHQQDICVTEVVADQFEHLPEKGRVTILPCAGERDHEERIADNFVYMTSIQTETLSDHLYLGTYREMMEHSKSPDTVCLTWKDDAGKPNLVLVDTQRYRQEIHVQSYHIRSDCGLILRTQSLLQAAEAGDAAPKPV